MLGKHILKEIGHLGATEGCLPFGELCIDVCAPPHGRSMAPWRHRRLLITTSPQLS
jgi:hypothetical protein